MLSKEEVCVIPKQVLEDLEVEAEKYRAYLWEPWEDEVLKKFYGKVPMTKIVCNLNKKNVWGITCRSRKLGLRK